MQTVISRIAGLGRALWIGAALFTFTSTSVLAQTNSWINPTSGNWENAASWSLGVPPGSSQSVMITNSGFKAVAINPSTPVNFPGSMTVNNLTINGTTNTQNTLLLNFFGIGVPLKILSGCSIGANGTLDNFESSFEVDGGLDLEGGIFSQLGGVTVVNGGVTELGGGFTSTNGNVTLAGGIILGSIFDLSSSPAIQDGGSLLAQQIDLRGGGSYKLVSGVLYAINGTQCNAEGSFLQVGGTNYGDIAGMGTGSYHLESGMAQGNLMSLGNATFEQDDGLLSMHTMSLVGGVCNLSNGILECGTLTMNFFSVVTQAGGQFFLTNNFDLHGESQNEPGGPEIIPNTFVLQGGEFISPSISIGQYGIFEQSGGSNKISGGLTMTTGSYTLSGGQFTASDLVLSNGANFVQSGGTVTLSGMVTLDSSSLTAGPGSQQFGELLLGGNTNSTLTLSPGASALHFANSSTLAWSSAAVLTFSNWNGSLSGGGLQQILFGNNSTGLTSQQLSQVQFINPAGLPNGTYSAQILASGEVVPNQGSSSSGLVNSWISPTSGNWETASSWSLGVPPASNQSVMITNSGFKAVAINSSTAINFPGSMSVSNLTIASPTNSANTLLMNFVGAGNPLVVGVNSNSPGSLIIGDTNSAMTMFSSGLIVNNALGTNNSHLGNFEVDGNFVQSDNSEVVAGFLQVGGFGTYNFTNGMVFVGTQFINGKFNQQGGTNVGAIVFTVGGEYDLFAGRLQGSVQLGAPLAGLFKQKGGVNISSLDLSGPGQYQLSGGLLVPGDLQVGPSSLLPSSLGAGFIDQTGGTNNAGNITMGVGSYSLEGGLLTASNLALPPTSSRFGSSGSSFNQSGGVFTNGGVTITGVNVPGLGVQTSVYTLQGGELDTPFITINLGSFNHFNGTVRVSTLSMSNSPGYAINGGLLAVDQIVLSGSQFSNNAGTMTGTKNLTLENSYWNERHAAAQFGQLKLTGNTSSFFYLLGNPCVVQFATSSGVPWSGGASLIIPNWSGSTNGGGSQQLIFGTSASGLTAQQLSQMQFTNPAGLPGGTYSARILSDGEVVPDHLIQASVAFSHQGNNLVLTWPAGWTLQSSTNVSGPYSDITNSTSPYTNDMTVVPLRFFRLRQ